MPRYRIEPERSRIWIDGRSTLHPIHSTTDGLEGFIEFDLSDDGEVVDDARPTGRLTLPSVRLSSGNSLEDRELHRRIDTQRFPTVEGVLTGIHRVGTANRYQVSGDLEFRGVSKRCEDEMTVTVIDERTIRLEGQSTFDIRDFGMQPPRMLMLKVEPEVAVRVEIVATREP